jgi:hypothetical protein
MERTGQLWAPVMRCEMRIVFVPELVIVDERQLGLVGFLL